MTIRLIENTFPSHHYIIVDFQEIHFFNTCSVTTNVLYTSGFVVVVAVVVLSQMFLQTIFEKIKIFLQCSKYYQVYSTEAQFCVTLTSERI